MFTALQLGLPDLLPGLIALAGSIVLVLALAAIAGVVYRHLTGGIEWPEDEPDDDVRRGDADDEWDYY